MTPNKSQLTEYLNNEISDCGERINESTWPIEIDSAKREREYLEELLVIVEASDHD